MATAFYDPSQGFQSDAGISVESEALARRRKLLEAMQQRAMTPQIQGNTAQGLGQVLASLGTTWLLKSAQDDTNEKVKTTEQARQANLQQNLGAFMDLSQGRAGDTLSNEQAAALMEGNVNPQLNEPMKANPRQAVIQAMASQHPELQAIGKMGLQEMMTKAKQPGFKDHTMPDGSLVRAFDDGTTKELGKYGKPETKWSDPFLMPGTDGKPLMVKRNLLTNEVDVVDKAPKVSATANASSSSLTKGQNAGMEQWAKMAGKSVQDLSEQARGSQQLLRSLSEIEKLNQTDLPGGPAANASVFLSGLARQFGVPVDEKKLANAQEFNAIANQVWLSAMNSVGGARGLTKEESLPIKENLPSLLSSPQGRQQVVNFLRKGAQMQMDDAKAAQNEYGKALVAEDPRMFTFGLGQAQLPPTPNEMNIPRPAPAGGGKPKVTNW